MNFGCHSLFFDKKYRVQNQVNKTSAPTHDSTTATHISWKKVAEKNLRNAEMKLRRKVVMGENYSKLPSLPKVCNASCNIKKAGRIQTHRASTHLLEDSKPREAESEG